MGSHCRFSEQCAFNACVGGVCVAEIAVPDGEMCSSNYDCVSRLCCGAQCVANQTQGLPTYWYATLLTHSELVDQHAPPVV